MIHEKQVTKVCTKCGETYPATDEYFPRTKQVKSGILSYCKACHSARIREWQHRNRDRLKAYKERAKSTDPEKVLQYGRDYRARKRDELADMKRRIAELEKKLDKVGR